MAFNLVHLDRLDIYRFEWISMAYTNHRMFVGIVSIVYSINR